MSPQSQSRHVLICFIARFHNFKPPWSFFLIGVFFYVKLQRLRFELSEAQKRIEELTSESEELVRLRRDQEDLLELLADQDAKLGDFKIRLRALGEKVQWSLGFFWTVVAKDETN